MEERSLSRLIEILETDPDFFVPVKKLWVMLQQEGLAADLSLEEFRRELEEDTRFEFIPDADTATAQRDPELAREMEALGFYGGPRVKLASRPVTVDDIFAAMSRSLAEMNAALQGAWETRPKWDQEVEAQLLDILTTGHDLMDEIQELMKHSDEEA